MTTLITQPITQLVRTRQEHAFAGPLLSVYKVHSQDGEPEMHMIPSSPNGELMAVNIRGTLLLRRGNAPGWDVVPAGHVALLNTNSSVTAVTPRGDQMHYLIAWDRAAGGKLGDWKQEFLAKEGKGDWSARLVKTFSKENQPTVENLINALEGRAELVEARLLGQLQMLSNSAVLEPETESLASVTTDVPAGIAKLIAEVKLDCTKNWSLKNAAGVAGYSQFHLSRTFRSEVGCGLPEYIDRCRIARILREVSEQGSKFDLATSAREAGFDSSGSFRDALRKVLGMLPSELRRLSQ
jgi:AraC-like DNA-binding protein